MYTNISKSQDHNCILMEDKAMLSNEVIQGKAYVQLVKELELLKYSLKALVKKIEPDEDYKGSAAEEENVTTVRELKSRLIFESNFAEQKLDISEGDIFKDIQEVWVVANIYNSIWSNLKSNSKN